MDGASSAMTTSALNVKHLDISLSFKIRYNILAMVNFLNRRPVNI